MALVIETGAQVANSNSYVSRAEYIAYAGSIGIVIADAVAADEQLIKAAEYIGQHEVNLKGSKVVRDQSMAFPRNDLYIEGWSWSNSEIPRQVTLCQLAYALDINSGVDIYNVPQNPNLIAKSKRVEGAVSIEYAVGENAPQKLSRTSKGDALLASLLKNNGLIAVCRS